MTINELVAISEDKVGPFPHVPEPDELGSCRICLRPILPWPILRHARVVISYEDVAKTVDC